MKTTIVSAVGLAAMVLTPQAMAQDVPKPIEITGSAAVASDYRFRGVSQTDKGVAVQAGITARHESGVYAGLWASNLAGWGTFGGSNTELDLVGGYSMAVGAATIDVGLTWYMYPGGANLTDFAEPYLKVSGSYGPASLLAGIAYAPKQRALGAWYNTSQDYLAGVPNNPGAKDDNLYLWLDGSVAWPRTPVTLKAHIGRSEGNPGLGFNGTSVAPTGRYWDWSLGADLAVGPLTLGVAWVDTDIGTRESAYLRDTFASTKDGSTIAGSTVVVSLTGTF